MQTATFGGGCFWCTEAIFQRLKGVESVMSGFSGSGPETSYEQVATGTTDLAESIQIKFDPEVISYEDLLYVFFKTHDPTSLNQQGVDTGPQYRSAVFYHNEQQKQAAEELIQKLQSDYDKKIVTTLEKFENFYKADEHHQNFYNNNRNSGYCRLVIDPKIKKLQSEFSDKLKQE